MGDVACKSDVSGLHPADGSFLHCHPLDENGEVQGPQIRIRKEIHKMKLSTAQKEFGFFFQASLCTSGATLRTDEEFDKFANCVRKLKDQKPTCSAGYRCLGLDLRLAKFERYLKVHGRTTSARLGKNDYPDTWDSFLAWHMSLACSCSVESRGQVDKKQMRGTHQVREGKNNSSLD